MMRQRQAAVPWLSRAPWPAANRAARRCPSSVSSSGATAAYTPAMDAMQRGPSPPRARSTELLIADGQQLRPD